jgi:hypothetical protein
MASAGIGGWLRGEPRDTGKAFSASQAERDALLRPVDWNIALHQVSQSELSRLGALEDGLSNARGEQTPRPDKLPDASDCMSGITQAAYRACRGKGCVHSLRTPLRPDVSKSVCGQR